MFEHDQEIVDTLLGGDAEFKALFLQHSELKEQVRSAELGILPIDDLRLGAMKREKLLAKDKMAVRIARYRRDNTG